VATRLMSVDFDEMSKRDFGEGKVAGYCALDQGGPGV
jgi:hypothetical protein